MKIKEMEDLRIKRNETEKVRAR